MQPNRRDKMFRALANLRQIKTRPLAREDAAFAAFLGSVTEAVEWEISFGGQVQPLYAALLVGREA